MVRKSRPVSRNAENPQGENSTKKSPNTSSALLSKQPQAVTSQVKTAFKPIFIHLSYKEIKSALSKITFKEAPVWKIQSANTTQVRVNTIEDKNKIIKQLKANRIGYYTFTEKAEKSSSFVLKGFMDLPCDEVLKLLQEFKVPAIKVSILIKNQEYVLYVVQFGVPEMNVHILNHNHKVIDSIIVKWERLKKSSSNVTQCYNCQQWGHTSQNCGFEFRCVKCTESHRRGECRRKTKTGDPKCVNCGGNHSASHRKCQAFISYAEKIKKTMPKPAIVKAQASRKPMVVNQVNFPSLPTTKDEAQVDNCELVNAISYAEKLSEATKTESLLKRLSDAQARLKEIPNIDYLIDRFCQLVDELEKTTTLHQAWNVIIKFNQGNTLDTSSRQKVSSPSSS